jgi:thiol-disulfide isomerase/thioredoxin
LPSGFLKFFKGREVPLGLLFFGASIVLASQILSKKPAPITVENTSEMTFDFKFEVVDAQKKKIDFLELLKKDKSTLVCLWATWCEPCVAELLEIEKHKPRLQEKYEIILVNVDGPESQKIIPEVGAWLKTQKISLETFFDFNDNLIRVLGIESIPHSFLVSKDKKIVWQNSGILDLSKL